MEPEIVMRRSEMRLQYAMYMLSFVMAYAGMIVVSLLMSLLMAS